MPDTLRAILAEAQKVIGFEEGPRDIFHPEHAAPSLSVSSSSGEPGESAESETTTVFLQGVLDRRIVILQYHSPYKARTENLLVEPLGIFGIAIIGILSGNQQNKSREPGFGEQTASRVSRPMHKW
jgi:hypothetical protein